MKRLILLLFVIFSFNGIYAQKSTKKSTTKQAIKIVSAADFSDNVENYINKTIKLNDVFYSHAANVGPWSDVSDMTLRMKGDTFEDLYGLMNYSNEDKDIYCRTITIGGSGGIKVNAYISKSNSNNMPNMKSGYIIVTGQVLNYNSIKIISITRRDNY